MISMNLANRAGRILFSILACGAAVPAAAQAPAEATIVFFGPGSPSYCGGRTIEVSERDGYRQSAVPAGKPITVISKMRLNAGASTVVISYSTCNAGVTFTPAAGAVYYFNSRANTENCEVELAREAPITEVGFVPERTASKPDCPAGFAPAAR